MEQDSNVVYKLGSGSSLLFVSQDGSEPAIAAQGDLVIYNVPQKGGNSSFKAQVGDVFWSLGTAVACVRVDKHAFSFSVPESPGLYLTLVLDHDTEDTLLDQLVSVLASATTFHATSAPYASAEAHNAGQEQDQQGRPQEQQRQQQQQDGIEAKAVQVARTASWLIRGAASAASFGLAKGAQMISQRVQSNGEPVHVSESTLRNIQKAQVVAECVASVTGRVASDVARVTNRAASSLSRSFCNSSFAESLTRSGVDVSRVSRVVAAGVGVLQEVFVALEEAGLEVLRTIRNATTSVVHRKYGEQAAAATHMGMGAATSVIEVHRNLRVLRPTRIISATAKQTAHNVLEETVATTTTTTTTATAANVTTSTSTSMMGPDGLHRSASVTTTTNATTTATTAATSAGTITENPVFTASITRQQRPIAVVELLDAAAATNANGHNGNVVTGLSGAGSRSVMGQGLGVWDGPGNNVPVVVANGVVPEGPDVHMAPPLRYPPVRYYPELPS